MDQHCPNCKAPVSDDAMRCPECDHELDPFATIQPPKFQAAPAWSPPPASAPPPEPRESRPRPAPPEEPAPPRRPARPPTAEAPPTPAPAPPPRPKSRPAPRPAPAPPPPAPAPAPAPPLAEAPPGYPGWPPAPAAYPPAQGPPVGGASPGKLRSMLIKMLGGQADGASPGAAPAMPYPGAGYPPPPAPPIPPPPAAGSEFWPAQTGSGPGAAPSPYPFGPPQEPATAPPRTASPLGPAPVDPDEEGLTRMMGGADVERLRVPRQILALQILDRHGQWHHWCLVGASGLKVGRSEKNAQFPELNSMATKHMRVSAEGTRVKVEDLGALNGVFVRLTGPVELEDGSQFRIGGRLVEFRRAEPAETVESRVADDGEVFWSEDLPPLAHLDFLRPDGSRGVSYPITGPGTVILGRESRAGRPVSIALPGDEVVSGQHAQVRTEGDRFFLEDLNSRNGTYLRIRQNVTVEPGEVLLIGRVLLRVVAQATP